MVKLTSADVAAINRTAAELGISPVDLTKAMLYETIGTMNPDIKGGAGGAYRGLIQFGPAERKAYGYKPGMSIADQVDGPVKAYLKDRGVKPGMKFVDIYSTINAGSPGHYGRRDASGKTVRQHVAEAEASYGKMARSLLAGGPVPPADIPNPTSATLRKGMSDRSTNGAVSRLQSQLKAAGFSPGRVDGIFGPRTQRAVKAFQQTNPGLAVDGVAGKQTMAALTTPAYSPGGGMVAPEFPSARGVPPPQMGPEAPGGFGPPSTDPGDTALETAMAPGGAPPMSFAPPPAEPSIDAVRASLTRAGNRAPTMGYAGAGQPPRFPNPPAPEFMRPGIGEIGPPGFAVTSAAPPGGFIPPSSAEWSDAFPDEKQAAPESGTSINDVLKGVGGIPDALGWQTVKGWFGGEEPATAKPSITIPYAVPPGGSDVGAGLSSPAMPGSRKSQQSSIGGFPQYAGGPNEFPTASPGNSLDDDLRIPTGFPQIDAMKNVILNRHGGVDVGWGLDPPANQAAVIGMPSFGAMGSPGIARDDERMMYANGETSLDPRRGQMFKSYPESYYSPDYAPAPFGSKGWMMRTENAPGGFPQFASAGNAHIPGPSVMKPSYRAGGPSPNFNDTFGPAPAAAAELEPAGGQPYMYGSGPSAFGGVPGTGVSNLFAPLPPIGYTPPPPVTSEPKGSKASQLLNKALGGNPGGMPSSAPWSSPSAAMGIGGPSSQVASWIGNYLGSAGVSPGSYGFGYTPSTPSPSGAPWHAPDFNPTSGGSTFAYDKDSRTFVTTDGRVMSY